MIFGTFSNVRTMLIKMIAKKHYEDINDVPKKLDSFNDTVFNGALNGLIQKLINITCVAILKIDADSIQS